MFRGSFILRLGLAIVFAYFALMQFIDPSAYVDYLPRALQGNGVTLVYLNGALDALLAVLVLFAVFPRLAPAVAAAHLLGIAFTMGFNDVAVRDFGLAMACLSLVFMREDNLSYRQHRFVDRFFRR